MWQYVYYMIYLDEKPSDQLNGPEAFVAGKSLGLAEPNAQDFLPSTALVRPVCPAPAVQEGSGSR